MLTSVVVVVVVVVAVVAELLVEVLVVVVEVVLVLGVTVVVVEVLKETRGPEGALGEVPFMFHAWGRGGRRKSEEGKRRK